MAGDGGKQLSGGERQRISLARAILKDAPIVVLDEATAFMDPENEEKMNEAIGEVIQGKTVVVIAHRLYSITGADQICVLDQGRLADMGTHEELLNRCEAYQKLWHAAEHSARWAVKPDAAQAKEDPHAHVRRLPRDAAQGRTSARGQAAGRRGAHRFQGQGPGARRVYLPQRRMLQTRPQDPRLGTRAGSVHFPRGVRRPGGTAQAR